MLELLELEEVSGYHERLFYITLNVFHRSALPLLPSIWLYRFQVHDEFVVAFYINLNFIDFS